MSQREKQLALALLAGLTQSDACRVAGYAESTIKARVGKLVSNGRIQSAMAQAMDQVGISPQMLAVKILEGLELTNPANAPVMTARHRYLETALRVGGHEPDKPFYDLKRQFEKAVEKAGLKDVTFHTLRHGCKSHGNGRSGP